MSRFSELNIPALENGLFNSLVPATFPTIGTATVNIFGTPGLRQPKTFVPTPPPPQIIQLDFQNWVENDRIKRLISRINKCNSNIVPYDVDPATNTVTQVTTHLLYEVLLGNGICYFEDFRNLAYHLLRANETVVASPSPIVDRLQLSKSIYQIVVRLYGETMWLKTFFDELETESRIESITADSTLGFGDPIKVYEKFRNYYLEYYSKYLYEKYIANILLNPVGNVNFPFGFYNPEAYAENIFGNFMSTPPFTYPISNPAAQTYSDLVTSLSNTLLFVTKTAGSSTINRFFDIVWLIIDPTSPVPLFGTILPFPYSGIVQSINISHPTLKELLNGFFSQRVSFEASMVGGPLPGTGVLDISQAPSDSFIDVVAFLIVSAVVAAFNAGALPFASVDPIMKKVSHGRFVDIGSVGLAGSALNLFSAVAATPIANTDLIGFINSFIGKNVTTTITPPKCFDTVAKHETYVELFKDMAIYVNRIVKYIYRLYIGTYLNIVETSFWYPKFRNTSINPTIAPAIAISGPASSPSAILIDPQDESYLCNQDPEKINCLLSSVLQNSPQKPTAEIYNALMNYIFYSLSHHVTAQADFAKTPSPIGPGTYSTIELDFNLVDVPTTATSNPPFYVPFSVPFSISQATFTSELSFNFNGWPAIVLNGIIQGQTQTTATLITPIPKTVSPTVESYAELLFSYFLLHSCKYIERLDFILCKPHNLPTPASMARRCPRDP